MKPYLDFRATRRSTVTMQVHADLRLRITSGEMSPKTSISENEIAQRYGVSRTPAREVLGRLEEEGLVEIYPQYGSFIAPIRASDVLDSQFVRENLECAALSRAMAAMSPAGLAEIEALIALQRRQAPADEQGFFASDEAMHALFFRLAGHERAWSVVASAKLQLDRLRHLSARDAGKRLAVVDEHEAVFSALRSGDEAAAVAALRQHLRGAFASLAAAQSNFPAFFAGEDEPRPPLSKQALDRPEKSATKLA